MRLALINQIDTLIQLVQLAENSAIYNVLVSASVNVSMLREKLIELQAAETTLFTAVKSIDELITTALKDEYNKAVTALASISHPSASSLSGKAPDFRYSTSGGWPSVSWRNNPDSVMYITDGPPSGSCGPAANP
jgi:hypothetical protein